MQLIRQLTAAKSWEERYRLIILAGKNLPRPSDAELAVMQPIAGCEAKVWFKYETRDGKNIAENDRTFHFQAYSEARIINGLLWILIQAVDGKSAAELRAFDLTAYFTRLGIARRLSATRLNGLKRIENIVKTLGD